MHFHASKTAALFAKAAVFLCVFVSSQHSWALISDDEARRAILDLRARVETLTIKIEEMDERTQNIGKGQLELLNENERLRAEVARLRGLIEETERKTSLTGDRQKDLYVDIDRRLKTVEPLAVTINGESYQVSPAEKTRFEEAQAALQKGEIQKAIGAFGKFEREFPGSALAPVALLARGSALYIEKNYKEAIRARELFVSKYPNHPKKPEALLNLAAAQAESGAITAARSTLQSIIKEYPDTKAAADAKERLKDLPKPAAPAKQEPAPKASNASKPAASK